MSKVVSGSYKSVHAAYQAAKENISVSITSVYNKINGIEPDTSAELVRFASMQVQPIIRKLGGIVPSPLPGKRIRLLDGNCIEKSQHRIKETRAAPRVLFRENHWSSTTPSCVYRSMCSPVRMATPKSGRF
jgi:hypothetical protein